jgi:hypothetical protein
MFIPYFLIAFLITIVMLTKHDIFIFYRNFIKGKRLMMDWLYPLNMSIFKARLFLKFFRFLFTSLTLFTIFYFSEISFFRAMQEDISPQETEEEIEPDDTDRDLSNDQRSSKEEKSKKTNFHQKGEPFLFYYLLSSIVLLIGLWIETHFSYQKEDNFFLEEVVKDLTLADLNIYLSHFLITVSSKGTAKKNTSLQFISQKKEISIEPLKKLINFLFQYAEKEKVHYKFLPQESLIFSQDVYFFCDSYLPTEDLTIKKGVYLFAKDYALLKFFRPYLLQSSKESLLLTDLRENLLISVFGNHQRDSFPKIDFNQLWQDINHNKGKKEGQLDQLLLIFLQEVYHFSKRNKKSNS